jgi:hypothetical protein
MQLDDGSRESSIEDSLKQKGPSTPCTHKSHVQELPICTVGRALASGMP